MIEPLSSASRRYSDSRRTGWKYRSRITGCWRGPTMAAKSDSFTVPSAGMPTPKSIRPWAVSPSAGSSEASSQVACASGVNRRTTGSGSVSCPAVRAWPLASRRVRSSAVMSGVMALRPRTCGAAEALLRLPTKALMRNPTYPQRRRGTKTHARK